MTGKTAVVIPAYGLQVRLDALIAAIPEGYDLIVVDDGSPRPLVVGRGRVLRHPVNRGYGAAQKSGYNAALSSGAERVVLLHGDGQYDVADTLSLAGDLDTFDAVLGSRFLGADPIGIPAWRRLGIRTLAAVANLRFGGRFTDLHNGARAFRAETLRSIRYQNLADDWRFDHQLVCLLLRGGFRVVERPVHMSYEGEVLSIPLTSAIRYGWSCLVDLVWPPQIRW